MQIFDSKEKVIKIFTFQQFCIPLLTLMHLMDQISYPPPVRLPSCSQSLSTLTVIEDFLAKRPVPPSPNVPSRDRPNQNWVRNLNYYRK